MSAIAVGALRLGTFIKYIPYPVTVGFTAGIAVIIFASQLRELFGLAGMKAGLGDWRPGAPSKPGPYGKFDAEVKASK